MIEDLVIAAVNQGLSKAGKESQKRMSSVSGSMINDLGDFTIPSDS